LPIATRLFPPQPSASNGRLDIFSFRIIAFLYVALCDALLGPISLSCRAAALGRIPELRNGRRTVQVAAFVRTHRLAHRLGLTDG
jgi:hypothetical protein